MIAQLRHGEETDAGLLERVLVANLDDTDFFVRKAPERLSRREALKHLDRDVAEDRAQTGTSSTAPTA